ncbi:hypothetical protein ACOMHN_018549 [Nucella lapillus]
MGMSLTFRDSPSNSTDAIGAYRVDNLHQCERLCWYRSPCTSYSFRPANSSLDEEENCVLHSASVEGVYFSVWDLHEIPGRPNVHRGYLRPRRKKEKKNPTSMSRDKRREGNVNGRWSTFADRCVQYLWPQRSALADVTSFLFVDFPRRLGEGEGWGMCVKGKMAATDRMFLNFMSQPYNDGMYSELPLHVDLRFAGAVYNSLNESGWRGLTDLGEMPIRHGADYQVSLHAAGSRLHVTLAGHVTYLIPLDHGPEVKYRIDLSHVRYLWMGDVLELSYLNLIDNCDDIL